MFVDTYRGSCIDARQCLMRWTHTHRPRSITRSPSWPTNGLALYTCNPDDFIGIEGLEVVPVGIRRPGG